MGRDFFAQLDWQEHQQKVESAGYLPYQDRIPEDFDSASTSSSGSSGSSGGSSDEFNQFQVGTMSYSSAGNGAGKPLDDEGGLLIGNFESGSGVVGGKEEEGNNPRVKLIEFGAEQSEGQSQPPPRDPLGGEVSKPAPYIDPFQQNPVASTASNEQAANVFGGGASTDMFGGVVFDPFGGLSAAETEPTQNANSAFGDLLGLGSNTENATPTRSSSGGSAGGQRLGNAGSGGAESTGDMFDPFGSIGVSQANRSGGNLLLPTLSTPANPSMGHRYSEPFTLQSSLLPPSASPGQARKLSSPTPGEIRPPPSHATSTLAASFSSNVSHSQPNLASLNGNRQPSATALGSGWGGSGFGGSASHNTSPRRSPSPSLVSQSSSSMGNIAQPPQQSNQFDPFRQFNLSAMTGNPSTAQTGIGPGSASTSYGTKPPTGNSYQPYYMQNQSQHRNGMQQQNQGNKQGTAGMGSKPKATSTFRTRPQSPNYNPSLFSASAVGNKTGASHDVLHTCSLARFRVDPSYKMCIVMSVRVMIHRPLCNKICIMVFFLQSRSSLQAKGQCI